MLTDTKLKTFLELVAAATREELIWRIFGQDKLHRF